MRASEVKPIEVTQATLKDFLSLPHRGWSEDIGIFDSLVILPSKTKHDSGFRCMDFVACLKNEAFCRLSGCSDVLHINGIGGFGYDWTKKNSGCPKLIPIVDWSIDCLPKSGLLRLFSSKKLRCGCALSSFEIFSIEEQK